MTYLFDEQRAQGKNYYLDDLDLFVNPLLKNTFTLDGSRVDAIQNIANSPFNLSDLTQPTAADRPLYNATGINGLPAIETDNADAGGQLISTTAVNVGLDFTITYLMKFVADTVILTTNYPIHLDFTGSGNTYNPFFVNTPPRYYNSRVGGDIVAATTAIVTTGVYIITVVYDVTTGTNGHYIRINGTTEATGNATATGTVTGLTLKYCDWNLRPMDAFFGPLMYSTTIPSLGIIQLRERYIEALYGLSVLP